jgi:hypothetical protein
MPRLISICEYRFVPPGFVHPLGYLVEVITNEEKPETIDLWAQRQANYADAMRLHAAACRDRYHPSQSFHASGLGEVRGCSFNPVEGLYCCALLAKRALDATRTDERTVLVRIHIPV